MNEDIRLLGEDDFLPAIENEIKNWRKEQVRQGSLTSFDGTILNYYFAVPQTPKAAVVIVHGMAEFFAKYHEYAWYLYQAGYSVFFMEQRGHGYSEGKMKVHDLIYVDDYDTYVKDLRCFTENVVDKEAAGLNKLLIAHSMGGAVATRYLEKYPDYFKKAVLSSPMIKMKSGNLSPFVVKHLWVYSRIFFKTKIIAPNQKHFNPETPIETSSAKSVPRFEYQLSLRRKDEHYQACAATFGWALASIKVHDDILKNAKKITTPIAMMTAGDDHLINPEGYREIREILPDIKVYNYPDSRHEIFNAGEETRKQYYRDVLTELSV